MAKIPTAQQYKLPSSRLYVMYPKDQNENPKILLREKGSGRTIITEPSAHLFLEEYKKKFHKQPHLEELYKDFVDENKKAIDHDEYIRQQKWLWVGEDEQEQDRNKTFYINCFDLRVLSAHIYVRFT